MKPTYLLILTFFCFACGITPKNQDSMNNNTIIRVETTHGNIDIRLYDETPNHRDNFIKLIKDRYYDDLLFHRVINNFMIQGGDPNSKNAPSNAQLGSGGPGYTIPAEINPALYHKKGALAAARMGDNVNPTRESSGSQFYIVHGAPLASSLLNDIEAKIDNDQKQNLYIKVFRDMENEFLKEGVEPDYQIITEKARNHVLEHFDESIKFKYTPEQRNVYTSTGGTPHLDGQYTVFGETIAGMEVIDKIAAAETNNSARPVTDIVMRIRLLDK
jgi:cyclophilin family peptidyl-prolyl cis-trans isomerase